VWTWSAARSSPEMTGSAWGKAGSVHMDAESARSQDRTSRERGCSARLGWRRTQPARGGS
jgi:hypothetical protein